MRYSQMAADHSRGSLRDLRVLACECQVASDLSHTHTRSCAYVESAVQISQISNNNIIALFCDILLLFPTRQYG